VDSTSWIESALFSALWQSSAWLIVGLVVSTMVARRPARAHGILLLCMGGAVLTPLLGGAMRLAGLGLLPGLNRSVGVADLAARLAAGDGVAVPTAGLTWIHAAGIAWIVLSAAAIARLAVSARRGRNLATRAWPLDDATTSAVCRRAAKRLGLDDPPVVCKSDAVRCPVIWCWGAGPKLILPSRGLDRERLFGVLCHELAHYRRRDHLASLAGELAMCLLPWNPLAWIANRRLRDLGEQACDSWAIASGASPTMYAETLLNLIPQRRLVLAPAACNGRKAIARRIHHILDGQQRPDLGRRWIVLAALATAVFVAGSAVAHRRPPTIEVVTATGDSAPLIGPDVITIPSRLDLGIGAPGQPMSRELLLCNRSERTHAVFGAVANCGCTTVSEFDPQTLSPGECMTVEVTMTAPLEPGTTKTKYVTFDIEGQAPLKLAVDLQSAAAE